MKRFKIFALLLGTILVSAMLYLGSSSLTYSLNETSQKDSYSKRTLTEVQEKFIEKAKTGETMNRMDTLLALSEGNPDLKLASGDPTQLNPSLAVVCDSCAIATTGQSVTLGITIRRNGNTQIANDDTVYVWPLVSNENSFYLDTDIIPIAHAEASSPTLLKYLFSPTGDVVEFTFGGDDRVEINVPVSLYHYRNNYITFAISTSTNLIGFTSTDGTNAQLSNTDGYIFNQGPYDASDNLFIHAIDKQNTADRLEILNLNVNDVIDQSSGITPRIACSYEEWYCEYIASENLTTREFRSDPPAGYNLYWKHQRYNRSDFLIDEDTINPLPLDSSMNSQTMLLILIDLDTKPVYRFWSDRLQGHFYTISESEKTYVQTNYPHLWRYERIAYYAAPTVNGSCPIDTDPIYRFWSDRFQAHFYTISESEKAYVQTNYPYLWRYERIAYCAYSTSQTSTDVPVYRFWSDSLSKHFYTSSEAEKLYVQIYYPHLWRYERIAFYLPDQR